MKNACTYPSLTEHVFTGLNCDFKIWLLSAYGTSRRFVGGVAAVLAASVDDENFAGKAEFEFKALDTDSRKAPKFAKVNNAEVLRQINYLHGIKALTDEQAAALLERHTPRRARK